jgi:hypothetical protein
MCAFDINIWFVTKLLQKESLFITSPQNFQRRDVIFSWSSSPFNTQISILGAFAKLWNVSISHISTFKFANLWLFRTKTNRLEFITNLMHNFIYSIIILHHDPQHVSSIAVLIFRRTIVYLQYVVPSHSVWQHTQCDDTRYCKYTIVLLKMSTAILETCWGSCCNIIIG